MDQTKQLENLVLRICDIGAVKLGQFKLKTGVISPIYFDLRVMVSFPDVLTMCVDIIWKRMQEHNVKSDFVCGVPYTALPIASALSTKYSFPMVVCRKERKEYGTGKDIEGVFVSGQLCTVMEDVVTSGLSVLESIGKLNNAGLQVKDVIAFLDREQGARETLESRGLRLISVLTASQLLEILERAGRIDSAAATQARDFFRSTKPEIPTSPANSKPVVSRRSYAERAATTKNLLAKRVFELMESKKSNLCVACDLTNSQQILAMAAQLGPSIIMLKTHVDIIEDFSMQFAQRLREVAERHRFLIFEDRKFADIGNTVKQQYAGGIYKIASWADISNTHLISGPSSVGALREAATQSSSEPRGMLLIAQMSTKDTLASGQQLVNLSLEVASNYPDFVCGFICQGRLRSSVLAQDDDFLYCTPGVQISASCDALGQSYKTPEQVIADGADVIIVGRGITGATDPSSAAVEYKNRGWDAYVQRCSSL